MGIRRRTVIFENSYVTKREQGNHAGKIHDINVLAQRRRKPQKYVAGDRRATVADRLR
jgi:hypothetical protein